MDDKIDEALDVLYPKYCNINDDFYREFMVDKITYDALKDTPGFTTVNDSWPGIGDS